MKKRTSKPVGLTRETILGLEGRGPRIQAGASVECSATCTNNASECVLCMPMD